MNINQNVRYALKLPADGMSYGSLAAIPGFSFGGQTAYTLSFSFYYTSESRGILLEQKEGFSLSIADQQILYHANSLGTIKAYLDAGLVAQEDFNCVDITYDKSVLRLYINGILCKETAAAGSGSATQSPYELGRSYATYLCRFRVANYALPQAEVYKNSQQNMLAPDQVEADIDFSSATPADVGKNGLTFTCEGFCIPKNIVRSLSLPRRGMAVPLTHPTLSARFSVLSKIYIPGAANGVEAVFSYGSHEAQGAICLGVKNDVVCHGFVHIGGIELVTAKPLPTSCWVDLAVTLAGKTVKLFVDGEEMAAKPLDDSFALTPGKVCIGNVVSNGRSMEHGFSGYIDSVCLFSEALSAAALSSLVHAPPIALSEHIQALYCLSNSEALDLVRGGMLSFSGGACIQLVENTIAAQSISAPTYDFSGSVPVLSAFEKWEAATVLDMIAQYMQAEHGLTLRFTEKAGGITAYPPALLAYARDNLLNTNEAQLALSQYNKPEKNHLPALITVLAATGGLMALGALLFAGAPALFTAAAAVTTAKVMSDILLVVAGVAAVGLVAAIIVANMTDAPPRPPEPKPDDKFGLALKGICFDHNPEDSGTKSALNITNSEGMPMPRPEWDGTGRESQCVYAQAPLLVPEIEVTLAYVSNPPKPCTITINGSTDLLFGSFTHSVTFPAPGSHIVKIPLPNNNIKSSDLGEKHVQINWTARLPDGKVLFMGNSAHCVFVMPALPAAPYSNAANHPESLLDIGMLSFCAKALVGTADKSKVQQKLHEYVRNSPSLTASAKNNYASHVGERLGFHSMAFFKPETSGVSNLGPLDANVLFALMCRASGILCNVAKIKSTLPQLRIQARDGTVEYIDPVLITNKVSALGQTEAKALEAVSTLYTNTNASLGSYDTRLYDPYYTIHLNDLGRVGDIALPFSDMDCDISGSDSVNTYREAFFLAGSFVGISGIATEISNRPLPGIPETTVCTDPAGQIGARHDNLVKDSNRPNFQASVKQLIAPAAGQDICHSISFDNIQSWTVGVINARDKSVPGTLPPLPPAIRDELIRIRNAVFVGVTPAPVPGPPHNAFTLRLYDGTTEHANKIRDTINDANTRRIGVDMRSLATEAAQFVNLLFNVLQNLRGGESAWNRSLGAAFDPTSWLYYDGTHVLINETGPQPAGTGWPGPFPSVGAGFYLTNSDDCTRINLCALIDAANMMGLDPLEVMQYHAQVQPAGPLAAYDFLYSSTNAFIANGQGTTPQKSVYYWNTNAVPPVWTRI